jgi:hypothetical protein
MNDPSNGIGELLAEPSEDLRTSIDDRKRFACKRP